MTDHNYDAVRIAKVRAAFAEAKAAAAQAASDAVLRRRLVGQLDDLLWQLRVSDAGRASASTSAPASARGRP